MKTTSIVAALTAASFGFAGTAFAQGNPGTEFGQGNSTVRAPGQHVERSQPQRGQPARVASHDDRGHSARSGGRGAGPSHNFYRGGHLPAEYRDHRYVVNDWRGHHLSAPPRGYHWVQTGDDFVLAAIATGVIASVLLNSH